MFFFYYRSTKIRESSSSRSTGSGETASSIGSAAAATSFELGRGSRKRKRRKFFDDDGANSAETSPEKVKPTDPEIAANTTPVKKGAEVRASTETVTSVAGDPEADGPVRSSVFRPGFLHDPFLGLDPEGLGERPEVAAAVLSWRKNPLFLNLNLVPGDLSQFPSWRPRKVAELLRSLLPEVPVTFFERMVAEEMDGEAVFMLCQHDLTRTFGLRLGPALKVFNLILVLKAKVRAQINERPKSILERHFL